MLRQAMSHSLRARLLYLRNAEGALALALPAYLWPLCGEALRHPARVGSRQSPGNEDSRR